MLGFKEDTHLKNAKRAMELIKELRILQDEIIESIMSQIDEIKPMKDVNHIGSRIATVKLSTIMENNFILSPDYYLADVQREEIKKHLSKCGKDIDKITERIKEMLDTGKIKGSTTDKTIMLNQSSKKALSEIYENLIS